MTNGMKGNKGDTGDDARPEAVDPTKNVLDLVEAESKYQDGQRDWLEKYENALREANDRRHNDLSSQRVMYEKIITNIRNECEHRIADMNQKQVDNLAILRGGQLSDLGNRITTLEQKYFESLGKTSVSDPALALSMREMSETLKSMRGSTEAGRGQVIAWVIAGVASLFAFIGVIVAILNYSK